MKINKYNLEDFTFSQFDENVEDVANYFASIKELIKASESTSNEQNFQRDIESVTYCFEIIKKLIKNIEKSIGADLWEI